MVFGFGFFWSYPIFNWSLVLCDRKKHERANINNNNNNRKFVDCCHNINNNSSLEISVTYCGSFNAWRLTINVWATWNWRIIVMLLRRKVEIKKTKKSSISNRSVMSVSVSVYMLWMESHIIWWTVFFSLIFEVICRLVRSLQWVVVALLFTSHANSSTLYTVCCVCVHQLCQFFFRIWLVSVPTENLFNHSIYECVTDLTYEASPI